MSRPLILVTCFFLNRSLGKAIQNLAHGCIRWPATGLLLLALQLTQAGEPGEIRHFPVHGVVTEVRSETKTVVIRHDQIPGYMPAMTMPFRLKDPAELPKLRAGDGIAFQLTVTPEESWIEQITKVGSESTPPPAITEPKSSTNSPAAFQLSKIPDFALTNEFGQRVSLRGYTGKALALTFMFTHCPIPEYCPRLSKNFAEASQRLAALPNGPTNWQLVSISFDPADTPSALQAYAQQYHYDSNHWSLLTGEPSHIASLTRGFGLSVTATGGMFSHDFRTAIFDASGRLQALWPFGGNNTDLLVQELIKAAAVTNAVRQAAASGR